jgi:hypothetical protein
MRIFELHFNPKVKTDLIFDSFCYEPENIYEKRLGSLYMVGELKNLLPQNFHFLAKLSQTIKEGYYTLSFKSSEQALKESLKRANEFLAKEVKKENVSWLGNLSFAVLSLKNFNLNFTKYGNLKILLLRGGKIIDIGKKLDFQKKELLPSKTFENIVSGKLAEDDKILILTEEIFSAFSEGFAEREPFLNQIAKLPKIEEKKLREILKENKELENLSGVCLLIQLQKEIEVLRAPLFFQKKAERFFFDQIFQPLFKISQKSLFFFKKISKIFQLKPKFFQFKLPLFFLFKISFKNLKERLKIKILPFRVFLLRKNLIVIFSLILLLSFGFFIFKEERGKEIKMAKGALEKVEAIKLKAENFLILKENKRAEKLFREAFEEILPQTKVGMPLREKAISLKENIEEKLFSLNKLEKDPPLKLLFEFESQKINFLPQKILASNFTLYFYSPFSKNLYKFNLKEKKGSLFKTNYNLDLATPLLDLILFYSKPNILLFLKDEKFEEKSLQVPYSDFDFNCLSSFKENLYFLDKKEGKILKFSPPSFKGKDWLKADQKKIILGKSLAIDESIWILKKDNQIDQYYKGIFQKTLKIDIFPSLENLTKIWTSTNHPFLYLLEPVKNRIIILDKKGEILKQYQSQEFDNLLDFAVSQDGKKIWLLNGKKVFELKI